MVKDLSHAEMCAELSSTVREVRGSVEALRGLNLSNRLQPGAAVQIWSDLQAAYACCSRMRCNTKVFAEVKDLHLLAWETEVRLSFVWVPRSHEALVAADHLSKWEDGGDWQFSRMFAQQQIFDEGREPDIDCLASAKRSHVYGIPYITVCLQSYILQRDVRRAICCGGRTAATVGSLARPGPASWQAIVLGVPSGGATGTSCSTD